MPSLILFEKILPGWVKDQDPVRRAAALWESLPSPLGHLVNAVLRDSDHPHCFVTGPTSVHGHYNERCRNFRQRLAVAERAGRLGQVAVTIRFASTPAPLDCASAST